MPIFKLTEQQVRWASRPKQKISPQKLKELVALQRGRCKLSGVPMQFDKEDGTPQKGKGVHPLYASIDHLSPGDITKGVQLVCYALNDLKGHLPLDCFMALINTAAWRALMRRWRRQTARNPRDLKAFRCLIRQCE